MHKGPGVQLNPRLSNGERKRAVAGGYFTNEQYH